MHNKLPNYFFFINSFKEEHIRKLDKKIAIIYRNYSTKMNVKIIKQIKKLCHKDKRKFFLSNNINLAVNLNLDGLYLPSFNKELNVKKFNIKKKFLIIGSAHTMKEIRIKEKQGVQLIFLAPLFRTTKNNKFLNTTKFNILAAKTNKKVVALGGINSKNIKKLKLLNIHGLAGITYFENNGKVNFLKNEYNK